MRIPNAAILSLLTMLTGCGQCPDPFAQPGAPLDRLSFPTGLALHPTQPILFAASSNGDGAFSTGAVMAAHLGWLTSQLELQGRVDAPVRNVWQAAVRTDSMGGLLRVSDDGRHLFHVTKGASQLVHLDVEATQDAVHLSCGGAQGSGEVAMCNRGEHVARLSDEDPFGMVLQPTAGGVRVHVNGIRRGTLEGWDFSARVTGASRFTRAYERALGGGHKGGSLALVPSTQGLAEYLLATGMDFPGNNLQLGTARMLDLGGDVGATPALPVDFFEQVGSVDVRGVVVSPAQQRAYFISKRPPALLEVDMSRLADGRPRGEVMRVALLAQEPSIAALYEPPNGPRLLLAASFNHHLLLALDLETMDVVGTVRDVGKNPFDIAVDPNRGLAFVSCHGDDTVAVVRLPRGRGDLALFLAARLGALRDDAATNPEAPAFLPTFNVPN